MIELEEIMELQRRFLRGVTNQEEEFSQGFLTVEHSLETLMQMHEIEPSIILKDNEQLAGYALTMPRKHAVTDSCACAHVQIFPEISYRYDPSRIQLLCHGTNLRRKTLSGPGCIRSLYQTHREIYSTKYDFIVTEISTRNKRSLKAHEKVGFKLLNIYKDLLDEWAVVIWDWRY